MAETIDYFFVGASPFTYLGHNAIRETAARHGAELRYRPVNIMQVWEASGAVPPAQRPPVRQRYRLIELQRIAHIRDLPINLKPKFFPADTTLADCCTMVLQQRGDDPGDYMEKVMRGVWVDDADMSNEQEVADRLAACDFDPVTILTAAKSEAILQQRMANSAEAVERDAVGVPSYVLNGEVFWGQDRIDYLDHALDTGRGAFSVKPG